MIVSLVSANFACVAKCHAIRRARPPRRGPCTLTRRGRSDRDWLSIHRKCTGTFIFETARPCHLPEWPRHVVLNGRLHTETYSMCNRHLFFISRSPPPQWQGSGGFTLYTCHVYLAPGGCLLLHLIAGTVAAGPLPCCQLLHRLAVEVDEGAASRRGSDAD